MERNLAQGCGIRKGSARGPHLPNAVVGLIPLLASDLDEPCQSRPQYLVNLPSVDGPLVGAVEDFAVDVVLPLGAAALPQRTGLERR
jgi:hypothetical protein